VLEEFPPITPVNFFQLAANCHRLPKQGKAAGSRSDSFLLNGSNYREYLLPDTSSLNCEHSFAEIAIGWSNEGIEVYAYVEKSFERAVFPEIQEGDSLEIMIDTRDVKTSGFNTRFCHHFFCLPEAVEGHQAGELTRFRGEDVHDLCDPQDLKVKSVLKKDTYQLQIFIPSQCLHGYDAEQFNRIGFTYRLNRPHEDAQHFSVATVDYQVEQQPSLWSTLKLI
jgi:hypothetical protein